MGITFDYLVVDYKYVFKSKEQPRLIVFENDYSKFIDWLIAVDCYSEYLASEKKESTLLDFI